MWKSYVIIFSVILCSVWAEDCHSTDPAPYRYYSTKSAYDEVRGENVTEEVIPGCRPIALHVVSRHASRYPGDKDITAFDNILPTLKQAVIDNWQQGRLCLEDVTRIANWTQKMSVSDDKRLSDTGRVEAFETARRFRFRFPGLLLKPYDKDNFHFKHTDKERTRETALMFATGLFNSSEGVDLEVANATDRLLRYYKNCEKYDFVVKMSTNTEFEKFKNGSVMKSTLADVNTRLGLPYNNLTFDQVEAIYDNCRFEHMIYRSDPWCAAFSQDNLKDLEYLEDLKYWFEDSYAHNISYEMACPLVEDLVKTFDNVISGSALNSVFRFGHSANINTFLTRLGLYRDDKPLLADNYPDMANRKWKSSQICPMAANVAFGLYSCDDGIHRVKSFVNERPVVLPGCTTAVCEYNKLRNIWGPIAASCDLSEICRYETHRLTGEDESSNSTSSYLACCGQTVIILYSLITFMLFL